MNKRGFVSKILQNFRKPEGFFGRMILWGMNTGHASLAQWECHACNGNRNGVYSTSVAVVVPICYRYCNVARKGKRMA